MQENLKLLHLPTVDASKLSSVGEFYRKVGKIETDYGIKLEFNENARWRPGSYERLKGQVVKALFPHWDKPKGANTIKRLVKTDSYQTGRLGNRLIQIDDELRTFRRNKQVLDKQKASEEGMKLMREYFNQINQHVDGVEVSITSLPYIAHKRRSWEDRARSSFNNIWENAWDSPILPVIDCNGHILDYQVGKANVLNSFALYDSNTNPQRWFVNIIIPIKDIDIEYYMSSPRDGEGNSPAISIDYGNLTVCFTVPLYDAVLNYKAIKDNANQEFPDDMDRLSNRLSTRYITNHTYTFPNIFTLQHPYVSSRGGFNTYGQGNTCFGDFVGEVNFYICTGMMGPLKAILHKWARTYYLGNTNPLNATTYHKLGLPKEWNEVVSSRMSVDLDVCRRAVREDAIKVEDLLENYCSNCQLTEKTENRGICSYYQSLIASPIIVPKDLDVYILEVIEQYKVPEKPDKWNDENITVLMHKVGERIINILHHAGDVSDTIHVTNEILRILMIEDCGRGNVKWTSLIGNIKQIISDLSAPEEEMDIFNIALNIYYLVRHAARMYWLVTLRNTNPMLWDELHEQEFADVFIAERKIPIASIKMASNHHAIARNLEPQVEYFDVLSRALSLNIPFN
tara:strand:- start:1039 stop:2916 length:1878 start_codon:yes stop_codon:yes gene_type:complete